MSTMLDVMRQEHRQSAKRKGMVTLEEGFQVAHDFYAKLERARLGSPVLRVSSQRIESLRHSLTPHDDWRALLYFEAGIAKYGEPFLIAEKIKRSMRAKYAQANPRGSVDAGFLARSLAFWEEYEEVNRMYLPKDPVYNISKQGYTVSTAASAWQMLCAAAGQLRILELFIGGESTVSTVLRYATLSRSAAGTGTTPTNVCTINKYSTRSPSSTSTVYGGDTTTSVNWGTTQDTLSGTPLVISAFNAFGGTDRWVSAPGEEVFLVNGEYASGRGLSGVPVVSLHTIWEEL